MLSVQSFVDNLFFGQIGLGNNQINQGRDQRLQQFNEVRVHKANDTIIAESGQGLPEKIM
jgi:hypothetical protein